MSSLTTAGSCSMEAEEEYFDTRLSLEIGDTSGRPPAPPQVTRKTTATVRLFGELIVSPQDDHRDQPTTGGRNQKKRAGSEVLAVASSGGGGGGDRHSKKKKQATRTSSQDDGVGRRSPPSDGAVSRKKLRLTSAQATMLEDSFRAHNILSHAQKQELARRVGLSARQVEVWFQNRRARTKLKQTEVDCELLRRWCDRLTDENARLRRDLAEIRAAGGAVVCPSCCDKKMAVVVTGDVA